MPNTFVFETDSFLAFSYSLSLFIIYSPLQRNDAIECDFIALFVPNILGFFSSQTVDSF